jgi:hypothetical protein
MYMHERVDHSYPSQMTSCRVGGYLRTNAIRVIMQVQIPTYSYRVSRIPKPPSFSNRRQGVLVSLCLSLDFCPIVPKLNIALSTQCTSLDQLTLLLHDVFKSDAFVREYLPPSDHISSHSIASSTYLQMIRYQMPVLAAGTVDQDSAMVVALLRDLMRRPRATLLACEGHLIRRSVRPSVFGICSLLCCPILPASREP